LVDFAGISFILRRILRNPSCRRTAHLARPGSGQNEGRPVSMVNRLPLQGIQRTLRHG
jgi:hypothetical protein